MNETNEVPEVIGLSVVAVTRELDPILIDALGWPAAGLPVGLAMDGELTLVPTGQDGSPGVWYVLQFIDGKSKPLSTTIDRILLEGQVVTNMMPVSLAVLGEDEIPALTLTGGCYLLAASDPQAGGGPGRIVAWRPWDGTKVIDLEI